MYASSEYGTHDLSKFAHMTDVEISNELMKYIKDEPSIKSATISLRNNYLYLMDINNTKLSIASTMSKSINGKFEQEGLLLEADLKENLAFRIANKMRQLFSLYNTTFSFTQVEKFKAIYKREEE